MDKPQITNIRKIIIGVNPKDAMAVEVGHTHNTPDGRITITDIVRNENNYYFFGSIMYQVYAMREGGKDKFVWKSIENVPVVVESFIPKER